MRPAFGPLEVFAPTRLSLPLALSAVLGGVTVGFFLAAPASVRAPAPLAAAQRTSQSASCCILSSLSATSCHSGPVSSRVGALLGGRGIGGRTRGVSQQFRFVLPSQQQAGIQAQEGVTNSHGAVHRSHQQGEEGQPLLPRRQREDNLTGDRHGNQPQQVDNLQRMEQKPLSTEGRVIRLLLKY